MPETKPARPLYTPQYETLLETGHTRTAPELSAPAIVWHVAVWPSRKEDPEDVRPGGEDTVRKPRAKSADGLQQSKRAKEQAKSFLEEDAEATFMAAVKEYHRRKKQMIGHANEVIRVLQERGRVFAPDDPDAPKDTIDRFEHKLFHEIDQKPGAEMPVDELSLLISKPPQLGFTLWWEDGEANRGRNANADKRITEPGRDALRVRVQAELQEEYLALTFVIDLLKPWGAGSFRNPSVATGTRRRQLLQAIAEVSAKAEARLDDPSDLLERPLLPLDGVDPQESLTIAQARSAAAENSIHPDEAAQLLDAAGLLYDRVWRDFCHCFDIDLAFLVGDNANLFANFRGLVLPTKGLGPAQDPVAPVDVASPGKKRFRKFGDWTDPDAPEESKERRAGLASREANATIKAFWPFIRRVNPHADRREHIACGIFEWRALYISALGSKGADLPSDEGPGRDYEDPALSLPEIGQNRGGEEPVRYLILTKDQPHRKQLGRMVDRINALGTMRLFALRNLSAIREASGRVRLRGQELDYVTSNWIDAKNSIETDSSLNTDGKNSRLYKLNQNVESKLMSISSALDSLGDRVTGGLPYRIARSKFYVAQFNHMRALLLVTNIDSWTSYSQFAERGLQPVYDMIEGVGSRLASLRARLTATMQSIQTVALVTQTEETRLNTRELQLLQESASNIGILGAVGIFLAALQSLDSLAKNIREKCVDHDITKDLLACKLHENLFTLNVNDMFLNYAVVALALCACLGLYLTKKRPGVPASFRSFWIVLAFLGAACATANHYLAGSGSKILLNLAAGCFLIGSVFFLFWLWALHSLRIDTEKHPRSNSDTPQVEESARSLGVFGFPALTFFAVLLFGILTVGGLRIEHSDNLAHVLATAAEGACQQNALPYKWPCQVYTTVAPYFAIILSCILASATGVFIILRIWRDKHGIRSERKFFSALSGAALIAMLALVILDVAKLEGAVREVYETRFLIAWGMALLLRALYNYLPAKSSEEESQSDAAQSTLQ
jgi:hypothetical protein